MTGTPPQRYRAIVEYDGTEFYGFQRQRDEYRTVQGEIERGLARINSEPVGILAAGRTDTGVHATGQVITFDLVWRHGAAALHKALNANLPWDISIRRLVPVAADFHPRFDARRRTYRYFIELCEDGVRRPTSRRYRWQVFEPLDLERLQAASRLLIGRHNFATFGTPPQGENCEREVFRAEWSCEASLVSFEIEANAFLYRMVRSLVGSLKLVGEGKWSVERFIEAFGRQDRLLAAAPAPAQGLFLVSVTYDRDEPAESGSG